MLRSFIEESDFATQRPYIVTYYMSTCEPTDLKFNLLRVHNDKATFTLHHFFTPFPKNKCVALVKIPMHLL